MNLNQAIAIAPWIQDFYDRDVSVVISDLESIIKVTNHKNHNMGYEVGIQLGEVMMNFQCIKFKYRQILRKPLETSEFGFSYIAISNPLWNNGRLEGAMTIIISDNQNDTLKPRQRTFELTDDIIEIDVSEEFIDARS